MDKVFCQNLRESRKLAGFTQKQVASTLSVVESCYANWEQGRAEPNINDLRRLCQIFDVTADYLLGLSGEGSLPRYE